MAALVLISLGPRPDLALAGGPPIVDSAWSSAVESLSARLSARVDPNGISTAYHFEYLTQATYQANGASFTGATKVPPLDAQLGSGPGALTVTQTLFGLLPNTTYVYRVVTAPPSVSPDPAHTFTTRNASPGPPLPDSRGWEMISPIDKNGGQVDPAGAVVGGGVLQAAADGDSVTYGSTVSFAAGQGAPPASQYLATRSGQGWATENISAPIFSGSYGTTDQGVPYRLFSTDLKRALLLNGDHCRGEAIGCPVANPPLPGTDAPTGYQDYYLRDNPTASFEALLNSADLTGLSLGPADFDLSLAGASPDLGHVILATCAALTPDATAVQSGSGCDPSQQNLYVWNQGDGLAPAAINGGLPGASLAAPVAAVSTTGDRAYWADDSTGDLYLHDELGNHPVDSAAQFQTATPDGAAAFYTKAGDLYLYDATSHSHGSVLASGVTGVLGASATGDTAYFQDANGLQRWHAGTTAQVAPGANATDPSDYPPSSGTVRVSSDGTKLLFLSSAQLTTSDGTTYDNTDLATGQPDSQVYLFDSTASGLACLSCNPTGERPIGPSLIPGALANGTAPGSLHAYKPRALSIDGGRVFFDSADALLLTDTNTHGANGSGVVDAYQWEAQGEGDCAQVGGCTSLISSGRSAGGALFVDASADGSDVFFLTDDSLSPSDPGALDLYDARIGGGFPVQSSPIPCEGDDCQALPSPPADPTLTTLLRGPGNPPRRYEKHCRRGSVKRNGVCVRKHRHPRKHRRLR